MNRKLMLRLLTLLLFLSVLLPAQAQTPEITADCENNFVAYLDSYNAKRYKEAAKYLQRVLEECPKMRESMYINGAKIFKERLDDKTETTPREVLIDSLFKIYDMRIEHFGDKFQVLQYKGIDMTRYALEDRHQEAQGILELVIDTLDNDVSAGVLVSYLQLSQHQFKTRHLDKTGLAKRLSRVLRIVDKRRKAGAKSGDATVETNVIRFCTTTLACDELKIVFDPFIYDPEPSQQILLQVVTIYGLKGCTSDPGYEKALTTLIDLGGLTPEIIRALIKVKEKEGDYGSVIGLLEKLAEMTTDKKEKAEIHFEIAQNYFRLREYEKCRKHGKAALELNPKLGKAWLLIADAYAASRKTCLPDNADGVTVNAVYWLVEDICIKAKEVDPSVSSQADQKIDAAREQFPRKADIFMSKDVKEGAPYKIGCWINEMTTVKARE